MSKEPNEQIELRIARAIARAKARKVYPNEVKGNVVCCLDQNTLNIDLRNLAIVSRSDHSRLQALLRHYEIPKGKESKRFAIKLRAEGLLEMIYPLRKKSFMTGWEKKQDMKEKEHGEKEQDVLLGFKM